jgi:hypothetical protein
MNIIIINILINCIIHIVLHNRIIKEKKKKHTQKSKKKSIHVAFTSCYGCLMKYLFNLEDWRQSVSMDMTSANLY